MVEELKLISEILGNTTDAALQGLIVYMVIDLLKFLVWPTALFLITKSALNIFAPKKGLIEVEERDAA